jgi:regulatory protein
MSGTITALEVQKWRKDRVNVFLDDQYAFSLQDILAISLKRGQTLTDQEIADLCQQDAVESAYEKALYYLSFRPRSEQEMRRYLKNKGLGEEQNEQILVRLKRARLVDDQDFARFWVESRQVHRPRGRRALRAELLRKGVPRDVIDTSIQDVDEEVQAFEAARSVVHRLSMLEQKVFFHRLLGYLQRRGFGYDIAMRVTKELWQETSSGQVMES